MYLPWIHYIFSRIYEGFIISFPSIYIFIHLFVSLVCLFNVDLFYGYLLFLFLLFRARPHHRQYFLDSVFSSISVFSSPFNHSNFFSTLYLYKNILRVCTAGTEDGLLTEIDLTIND